MLERIMGVITLKAPVYRAIAEDKSLTSQAGVIVAVIALIQGFCTSFVKVATDGSTSTSFLGGIVGAFTSLVLGLIAWVFSAWLLATIAKMLDGKTDTGEMLRVTGFVAIFGLTGIFNLLALVSQALTCVTSIISLVVFVLSLIGYFIGVREAAEFSTGKAIITAILATIANFIIVVLIGGAVATALAVLVGLAS